MEAKDREMCSKAKRQGDTNAANEGRKESAKLTLTGLRTLRAAVGEGNEGFAVSLAIMLPLRTSSLATVSLS